MTTSTTSATFCAFVFTSMNIHMLTQASLRWKTFLTLSTCTWIQVFCSVSLSVNNPWKLLVTHWTQIQHWQVLHLQVVHLHHRMHNDTFAISICINITSTRDRQPRSKLPVVCAIDLLCTDEISTWVAKIIYTSLLWHYYHRRRKDIKSGRANGGHPFPSPLPSPLPLPSPSRPCPLSHPFSSFLPLPSTPPPSP